MSNFYPTSVAVHCLLGTERTEDSNENGVQKRKTETWPRTN